MKYILLFLFLINSLNASITTKDILKNKILIKEQSLPAPYDYLLTQPLMTKGIEKYYQRTPIIRTIKAHKNEHDNTYSRQIIMLLDTNKKRNNPELAQKYHQDQIVELAFITMNLSALPDKIISEVLNSKVPFGQLLIQNKIKINSQNRSYFFLICNKQLSELTHCRLKNKLYGRTNTLVNAKTKQWLAQVIEILT